MSILGRIKKAEEKLDLGIGADEEFCGCFADHFKKMLDKVYDGAEYEKTDDSLPTGDFCDNCKRTVSKLNKDYFENVKLIYGSTFAFVHYAAHLKMPEVQ